MGLVVLKEGQEIIIAIGRKVRRVQVGEQLIRVGQLWKQLWGKEKKDILI